MTVTSRLHRQKDTERQRKTEENVERRPVVARRYIDVMDRSVPRVINFRGRIRNCRDQPSWPMRGGRGDVTEREFTLTQSEVASVRAELQSTRATLIKTEAS